MSLLQGSISLRRFLVIGLIPNETDLLGGLTRNAFHPFEDSLDEERIGWCDWRNLLIAPPDKEWLLQERFALFSLRLDSRKIPVTLLKAEVDLRLSNMQKNNTNIISKDARISLKDEVKAELLLKVLPVPKIVDVAWDLKQGMLWTTASSVKMQSVLITLFNKSFGCELQPLATLLLANQVLPGVSIESLIAMTPLDITSEIK